MGHKLCICLASADKTKQDTKETVPIYTPTSRCEFQLCNIQERNLISVSFILSLMSKNLIKIYEKSTKENLSLKIYIYIFFNGEDA